MSGTCFFVSDLHGKTGRYEALFEAIERERPAAVFFGGDLLPGSAGFARTEPGDFVDDFLVPRLRRLQDSAPLSVFLILGNDDARVFEPAIREAARTGVWTYLTDGPGELPGFPVIGYPYIPPTPFQLKDWERFDVSRYVDPGCVAPEDGQLSVPRPADDLRERTIAGDLVRIGGRLDGAILVFHAPPYRTVLDRAALDDVVIDHVPADVHVGSIAVRRFIEDRQPLLTLHGHVHESPRLTGQWRCRIGRTHCLSAAHDGPELALVRFDPEDPESASLELVPTPDRASE